MIKLPSKEEVLWALNHPNTRKAMDITNAFTSHPKWSSGKVLHRCPLCEYETTVTNIHRECPKNPIKRFGVSVGVPMYVVEDAEGI